MNAAGIDVSSRKSTVAVLRPFGEVVHLPFDVARSTEGLASLSKQLKALLEQSFPGIRKCFDSPVRSDGTQKWVDFAHTFWHVDCVRKQSYNAFLSVTENGASATAISSNKAMPRKCMPLRKTLSFWFLNPG